MNEFIELDEKLFKKIIDFKPVNNTNFDITKFIKDKIQSSKNRDSIISKKLFALYLKETGIFVCKSTIYNLYEK